MARISVKAQAKAAQRDDLKARKAFAQPQQAGVTLDSFVNLAHKMGVGVADSPLTSGTYGFNPITRNRTLLEWIHRGSWLGGVAIDLVANDMTRAGVEFLGEMEPDDEERIESKITSLGVWNETCDAIKWGRLYGGSICVALIDGQDLRTPLRPDTVGPGQFRGLLALDRWMVEPALEDLVTEYGPHLGLPKFYRVQQNAPALRGAAIHHSRVMFRLVGVKLPYQQRLNENLWGLSVLERLWDRMIGFDSATTGAAQLVFRAFLRTLSVEGLREIVAAGGKPLQGLMAYAENMRRFQTNEGLSMIDAKDKLEIQGHSTMSGIGEVLTQLKEQLCGALEIPATRLFGVSGGGLNGTNDGDMRLYYDSIKQAQQRDLHGGLVLTYKMVAASEGIALPPNFNLAFRSLWELSDGDKASIANQTADAVSKAVDEGLIGRQTALKELRQSSRRTGIFTNITEQQINAADDDVGPPPGAEGLLQGSDDLGEGEAPPGAVPGLPGAGKGLPGAAAQTPDTRPRVRLVT